MSNKAPSAQLPTDAQEGCVSLEESVRAVVREEMKRVLREELRAAIEQLRAAPNAGNEFLSVKEAAELTRVSEATVRDWMKRGLKRYGQGHVVRIRRAELLLFLSASTDSAGEDIDIEDHAIAILRSTRRR
jgi:excisionase family DNA binding protein